MSGTLFDRLGGEDAINAGVDAFYAEALANNHLKSIFEEIDMEAPRGRQKALLVAALGGPEKVAAKPFDFSPWAERMNDDACAAASDCLRKVTRQFGLSDSLADELEARALSAGLLQPSGLYERLGGEAGIGAATDAFYALAAQDGRIQDAFEEIDMEVPRGRQKALLIKALGGPEKPAAKPFDFGVYAKKLSDIQLEAIGEHLETVLSQANGEARAAQELKALAVKMREDAWRRDRESSSAKAPPLPPATPSAPSTSPAAAAAAAPSSSASDYASSRPGHTLFDQIGGWEAVNAAVDNFYAKILKDERINGFFHDVDMRRQRERMRWFLAMAFGGPKYSGRSMREVHRRLVNEGLGDRHFNIMLGHIKTTMQDLNVAPEIIENAMTIVETTRADVLNQSPKDALASGAANKSSDALTSEDQDVSMWKRIRHLWRKD